VAWELHVAKNVQLLKTYMPLTDKHML